MAVITQDHGGTVIVADHWTTDLLAAIAGFDEHRPGKPWTIILAKDGAGVISIIEGRPTIDRVFSKGVPEGISHPPAPSADVVKPTPV